MIRIKAFFSTFLSCIPFMGMAMAQQVSAPEPQTGTIIGTITDVRNDIIPGAIVTLDGPDSKDRQSVVASDNGFFQLTNVKAGVPYHVVAGGAGFADWTSPEITLMPGQYMELKSIQLQIAVSVTTVAVTPSPVEIATEQVHLEEKQRILGFIPNFYVVYDKNPAPLTAKLKFQLAFHTMIDPVTIAGNVFISAVDQAADTPSYQQGWKGYGQRFGANYANGVSDILIAGAVLPSILHQDPRYYYQGTGTTRSRVIHALSSSFICKGDNGRLQPNYSSLGGYMASGALAETYYPERDRGPGLVFGTFGLDVAANMANGIIQEFILKKFTPSAKKR